MPHVIEQPARRKALVPERLVPGQVLAESATEHNGMADEQLVLVLKMRVERGAPDQGSLAGTVRNKAVYLAIGVTPDGREDVLGLWIEQSEGAKFWMRVMAELKHRGVDDILIAVVRGGACSVPEKEEYCSTRLRGIWRVVGTITICYAQRPCRNGCRCTPLIWRNYFKETKSIYADNRFPFIARC